MRAVTLTKTQFDEHVFPAFTAQGAEDERQLEVALRVLRKFREVAVEDEVDPRVLEKLNGKSFYPNLVLPAAEQGFQFEEDEHRLLLDRMKAFIPRINILAAEDFMATLSLIRDVSEANARED